MKVLISRKSPISGRINVLEIPADPKVVEEFLDGKIDKSIQQVFPDLDPAEREFILTGITPEEWNVYVKGY